MKIARRPRIKRTFLAGSMMLALNAFSCQSENNRPSLDESKDPKTSVTSVVSPALLCIEDSRPNNVFYPDAVQKIKKSFGIQGPNADRDAGHLLELQLIMKCHGFKDRHQIKGMWEKIFYQNHFSDNSDREEVRKQFIEERRLKYIRALPEIFESVGLTQAKIEFVIETLASIDILQFFDKIDTWVEIAKNRIKDQPDGRPLALNFSPLSRSDWNSAFLIGTELLLANFIEKDYRVMHYEVDKDEFFFEQLKKTRDGEQQARAIVIGGHGYEYGLNFSSPQGEVIDALYLGINDGPKMIKGQLGRALELGGQVILMSCSTGQGREKKSKAGEIKITNLANVLSNVFTQASHVWAPVDDAGKPFLGFDEQNRVDWVNYGVEAYDAAGERLNKRFLEYGLVGQGSQKIEESLQIFNNMPQSEVVSHLRRIVEGQEPVDYKRLLEFFAQYPAELLEKSRALAKDVVEKVLATDELDWNELLLSVIQKLKPEECEGPIFESLLRKAAEFYDDKYDPLGLLLDLDHEIKDTIISLVVRQIKDNPKLRRELRDRLASQGTLNKHRRLYADLVGRIKDKDSIKILKRILGVGLLTRRDKDEKLCQIALESRRETEND